MNDKASDSEQMSRSAVKRALAAVHARHVGYNGVLSSIYAFRYRSSTGECYMSAWPSPRVRGKAISVDTGDLDVLLSIKRRVGESSFDVMRRLVWIWVARFQIDVDPLNRNAYVVSERRLVGDGTRIKRYALDKMSKRSMEADVASLCYLHMEGAMAPEKAPPPELCVAVEDYDPQLPEDLVRPVVRLGDDQFVQSNLIRKLFRTMRNQFGFESVFFGAVFAFYYDAGLQAASYRIRTNPRTRRGVVSIIGEEGVVIPIFPRKGDEPVYKPMLRALYWVLENYSIKRDHSDRKVLHIRPRVKVEASGPPDDALDYPIGPDGAPPGSSYLDMLGPTGFDLRFVVPLNHTVYWPVLKAARYEGFATSFDGSGDYSVPTWLLDQVDFESVSMGDRVIVRLVDRKRGEVDPVLTVFHWDVGFVPAFVECFMLRPLFDTTFLTFESRAWFKAYSAGAVSPVLLDAPCMVGLTFDGDSMALVDGDKLLNQ
jgi:hypothetical protein